MTTYELQSQHTPTQSAAGNWAAVAAVLSANIVSPYTETRSYNEVLETLGVADMEHTLAAFSGSEIGSDGRQMLVTVGLSFAHQTTVQLINQLQTAKALREGVAEKLLALGTQTTQLARGATADQCRDDWQAGKLAEATKEAAAIRTARIASIQRLEAESVVDGSKDIDTAIAAIRTALIAHGGWQ